MKFIFIILVAFVAFAAGVWYAQNHDVTLPFATFTEEIPKNPAAFATYHNASADRIIVDTPKPGDVVSSMFTITGKARGNWYFEASFPLRVLSSHGSLLKEMPVQADGEWMTTEFVSFSETVTLPLGYTGAATLILHNDNASGLPENDAFISIPIVVQ